MELTYSELKKRDVINVVDGKCLGRITDIKFCFPFGTIEGIMVPGRKTCAIANIFIKTTVYIPKCNIVRIGGDVILVDLSCGEQCSHSVDISAKKTSANKGCDKPCVPICPPNPCINVCQQDAEIRCTQDAPNCNEKNNKIDFDEF